MSSRHTILILGFFFTSFIAWAADPPGTITTRVPLDNIGTSSPAYLAPMQLSTGDRRHLKFLLREGTTGTVNTSKFNNLQIVFTDSDGVQLSSQTLTRNFSLPSDGYCSTTLLADTINSSITKAGLLLTSTAATINGVPNQYYRVVAGWWRVQVSGGAWLLGPVAYAAGTFRATSATIDNFTFTTGTGTGRLNIADINPTGNIDWRGRNLTDVGNLKTTGTLYSPDLASSFTAKADATSVTTSLNKKANNTDITSLTTTLNKKVNLAGNNTLTGNFSVNGNMTLGDTSADEHTINGDLRITSGVVLTANNNIRPSADGVNAIRFANAAGTEFGAIDTTNNRVAFGSINPRADLTVYQTNAPRGLLLSGAPIIGAANTSGPLLSKAYSDANHTQLWLGDSRQYLAAANESFRWLIGNDVPGIDGVQNNGSASTAVNFGSQSSKVGIGFDVGAIAKASIGASLHVRGAGTAAGSAFIVEDSAGTDRFKVYDNGRTELTSGPLIHAEWAPRTQIVAAATSLGVTINYVATVQTANANVELPPTTGLEVGWTCRIMAAHASGCTITTDGDAATINGAVTCALAQWYWADCIYGGGTVWYALRGHP